MNSNVATALRRGGALLVALALTLALALALLAGQARAQAEPDTTPPTVQSVSPADGSTAVDPAENVTATFSEAMDPATISAGTFTLTREGSAGPVTASVGYDDPANEATLNPASDLVQGAAYEASVTTGATDTSGNALDEDPGAPGAQPKTWSFRVADVEDPTVTLTRPEPGSEVGKTMPVEATASDNLGVSRVEFLVDGVVKATDEEAPYSASLDTTGFAHASSHAVTARAFDAAGNEASSAVANVTLDHEVSLTLGDAPAQDGFTKASPVPLSFTTDADVPAADRECRVVPNGFSPCTSPYAPNLADDGPYTYEVRVIDDAGNQKTSGRSFTLDRTAPTLAIQSGPDGGTFGPNTTQTWAFSAGDATSGLSGVECSVVPAGEAAVYGPCAGAGSHSVANRGDGSHEFKLRATDRAGNQRTLTRTFSIDATAPAVSLTNPAEGAEVRNAVNVAANASDAGGVARVDFLVDGEVKNTDTTDPYSATLDTSALVHGSTHTVAARAVDAFGNGATASRTIVVDRQVSLTLGNSPTAGGFTNATSVPLSFDTDSDVAAGDRECRATRTGTTPGAFAPCDSPFSPTLSADGEYTYDVRVTDNVGNVARESRAFTLDRTAPTLAINAGPDGGTFGPNTTQTWTFSAGDATSGQPEVRCSVVPAGEAASYGACSAANSHSVSDKGGGSYEFKVRATDGAGNVRAQTRTFAIDATAPNVGITSPNEGQKVGGTVRVGATASDDVPGDPVVEFLVDGLVEATDGAAPYSADLDMRGFAHESSHTLTVRARDGVGNTSLASRTVILDLRVSLALGEAPAAGSFTNAASVPLSFETDADVPGAGRECRATRAGAAPGAFAPCAAPFAPALTQDGAYTYEVRVTDDVGNTRSAQRAFTLDRTNPTLTIASGPDGGTFGPNTTQTWGFTAGDATSGPAEVRCSVVPAGAAPAYEACATGSGHSVSNKGDGAYEFRALATDKAGNRRELTRTFRIDATNPAATLTGPATGTKVGKTMTVAATAADELGAPKVEFLVDGELKRTVTAAPYTADLDMALYGHNSAHTVAARAVDGVGNVSALSEAEVTVDKQVSLTLGNTPVQGSPTNAASVPISFTTEADVPDAGRECRAVLAGAPADPFGPCSSPYAPDLAADGRYTYEVRVTDDVGNTASASRTFTLDRTNPTLAVNGPEDQAVVGPNDTPTWTFSRADATTGPPEVRCSVTALGASPNYVACGTATSHSFPTASRPDGQYELRVRAVDGAGNVTEVVRRFAVDRTPPAVQITSGLPDGASTNQSRLTWGFSSAEPDATFQCRVYASGTTPAPFEDGSCSGGGAHTAQGLSPGRYTFEVRGLDTFGNRLSGPSAARDFTVDTAAPRVLRVSPVANARNVAPSANITATFSEKMLPSTVGRFSFKLTRIGTAASVSATVRLNGTTNVATLNPTNTLARGATYKAVVTAGTRDLAGNRLAVGRSWSFKVR